MTTENNEDLKDDDLKEDIKKEEPKKETKKENNNEVLSLLKEVHKSLCQKETPTSEKVQTVTVPKPQKPPEQKQQEQETQTPPQESTLKKFLKSLW